MLHTPCPTLHREIGQYLSFMDEARKEAHVPEPDGPYEAAVARAEAIKASNPETPGPGRYGANDDRILAELLDEMASDQSFWDGQVGSVDEIGWFALIGRFVVETDDQGFFYYQDYGTEEAAKAAFDTIEAEYPVFDD